MSRKDQINAGVDAITVTAQAVGDYGVDSPEAQGAADMVAAKVALLLVTGTTSDDVRNHKR